MGVREWLHKKIAESRARPRPKTAKRLKELKEREKHRKALKEAYKEGKRKLLLEKRKRELAQARKGVRPKSGGLQRLRKYGGKFLDYAEGVGKNIEEDPLGLLGPRKKRRKRKKKR